MEEIFDIYTRDGKYLGTKEKSVCHSENPGFYHKPVWIWIINNKNEILVQKRASCKKNFPNLWDMPSAGHIISGETPIQGAIRETYEELGIKTTENDYLFVGEYIADISFEIAQIYLLKLDLDISKFHIQKDEVSEIKWISFNEFEKLFYSDDFVPFEDEYRLLVLNLLRKTFNNFNIILTSSGFNDINNYVSDEIKELFTAIATGKKVRSLANAAPEGTGNYIARENVKNNFLSIGATTADIIDINNSNLKIINNYDIIYGLGGDPQYLIELNQETKFKNALIKFLNHGIYIGESAGSMILCDNLKWTYTIKKGSKPKYDIELDSYDGLALTDYRILPHANKLSNEIKEKTRKFEKENNIKITKLKDGEYILTNYETDNPMAIVVSNDNTNVTPFETIDAIKQAGFKNIFIQWYNKNWKTTQEEQLKYIRKCGLNVIFAHLGYQNINDIWDVNDKGNLLVERYKNDIDICKQNNIPMVVMHLTSKSSAPMYNEIGLKRIKEIVDYADFLGIKVAFENTKIKGYLEYVIENISNKNVGICFDSGHCHVHFDDDFDFDKFKNRIFAVHLHDNDKSGDLHLLPFDGTIDWEDLMKKLINCNYNGPITLELCYSYDYLKFSLTDFYKKGYNVGLALNKMLRKDD